MYVRRPHMYVRPVCMYVCMYVGCGVYVCTYVCRPTDTHMAHTIFRTKFKRSNGLVLKISHSRTHCERVRCNTYKYVYGRVA